MPKPARDLLPFYEALQQLRLRLLDLTGRNRLVNFRHTPGKSLQFVHSDLEAVCDALLTNGSEAMIAPLPEPGKKELKEVNGRVVRPDAREFAASRGINCHYDLDSASEGETLRANRLQTLFYADDLGRHCRKLEREARLAIEETGANMLHLVVGFLEFPDVPGSERLYLAPLLSIPVAMRRVEEGQYSKFYLSATGEEILDNLSLREKLKRDHSFAIPEYDPEGDESVAAFLDRTSQSVEDMPQWRVRPMMTLTLLSFANS